MKYFNNTSNILGFDLIILTLELAKECMSLEQREGERMILIFV